MCRWFATNRADLLAKSPYYGSAGRPIRGVYDGPVIEDGTNGNPFESAQILRLIGVYNADSTLRGELSYVVGRALGRRNCALCDVTHGNLRERSDWKRCRAALAIPFDTFHRDDQPAAVRDLVGDSLPVVVAETDTGIVWLLDSEAISRCGASPERFMEAVESAAHTHGLAWI